MTLFAAVALALLAPSTAPAATISAVDVGYDSLTLRFDDAVEGARMFLLDEPQRIALDIVGARAAKLPAVATDGFVSRARGGQRDADTARVVFDLATPTIVTDAALATDGRSLTLSVAPASKRSFAEAVRERARTLFTQVGFRNASPATENGAIVVPLEPARPYVPYAAPPIRGGRGTNRPLVVIDPGHGGHDPGAISVYGGRKEKDAALAIARAIRDALVATGRVRVALTRDDDRFLVLQERREIARRLKADLFISIHADSAPADLARGASIYTLSEVASDQVAARLAARENRSDVLNGVNLGNAPPDVSSILVDLAQRESMNMSSSFATLMQREMAPSVPFRSSYHRFAAFAVLKAPDVPSVLLETGYMSNIEDSKFLFSSDGRAAIADGVTSAVTAYFARRMASR
ncbi:N-acetylmuramoyl-L-alanine amidase [Sphingomonas montana]|uniref:N-acetylmuramoyl-L-alanine amidase n=1 Tax=Sphingomonas montana TaxID=1843236 RepID=UPI00096D73C1|nr:N-acetylmuramoyl-L-alanine amidase [Sphingomonas montana]